MVIFLKRTFTSLVHAHAESAQKNETRLDPAAPTLPFRQFSLKFNLSSLLLCENSNLKKPAVERKMTIVEFGKTIFFALGGVSSFAYYVANTAEDVVNQEAKKKFANIVKNIRATPTFRHAFLTFTMMSDNYFGDKLLSLRAFAKSVLLSLAWIFLLTVFCVVVFPNYASWFTDRGINNLIIQHGIIFLVVVLVLDYLSVTVTRFIIRTYRPKNIVSLILLLALDLFLSIVIFYVGFSITKYYFVNQIFLEFCDSIRIWLNLDQLPLVLVTLEDLTSDMFMENKDGSTQIIGGLKTEVVYAFPEGIVFYSSLLTSIWLWFHTASYIALKIAIQTDFVKKSLLNIANIEQKPFKSLATIILLLYPVVCCVLIAIYWLVEIFR